MKIIASTLCIALLFLSLSVSAQQPGNGFDWYSQGKTVHFFPQDSSGYRYDWDFGDILNGTSEQMTPTYTYLATDGEYIVTLRITHFNGTDTTYTDTVGTGKKDNSTIIVVNSITEQIEAEASFCLFPNPASDQINLLLPNTQSNTKVCMYDISGRQLIEQHTNLSHNIKLNVAHLPEGLYFVEISNSGGVEVRKIKIAR